jgi:hypothetical protein
VWLLELTFRAPPIDGMGMNAFTVSIGDHGAMLRNSTHGFDFAATQQCFTDTVAVYPPVKTDTLRVHPHKWGNGPMGLHVPALQIFATTCALN